MEITPIKRTKLNDEVFLQMKQLLSAGVWKPGERIPSEFELCERFAVSRITVRQALQNLTSIGLIETRPGKGRFVCTPEVGQLMQQLSPALYLGSDSSLQVNEFREMLDVWSAKLAAQRAEPAEIEALQDNYDAMACCAAESNWAGFAELDLQFHVLIGSMTRNTLITHTYAILHDALQASMHRIVEQMEDTGLAYHRQLIDAIAAGDSAAAERIARNHLENNRNFLQD